LADFVILSEKERGVITTSPPAPPLKRRGAIDCALICRIMIKIQNRPNHNPPPSLGEELGERFIYMLF